MAENVNTKMKQRAWRSIMQNKRATDILGTGGRAALHTLTAKKLNAKAREVQGGAPNSCRTTSSLRASCSGFPKSSLGPGFRVPFIYKQVS
jgi:hypothetical protein